MTAAEPRFHVLDASVARHRLLARLSAAAAI